MTATVYVRSVLPGTWNAKLEERSSVGHAWIEIHHPDGSIESFGFYPKESAFTAGELSTTKMPLHMVALD